MSTSKSYLIKIGADASAVTKAIQGINGQTSSLKRLAGTLDSAFKINGDTSVLKAKLTALNGAVKSSEQSASSLKAQFAKMSSGANFNPASASAQKLQMRIAQADAETLKLKAQADQTSSALDKMANADIEKLGNEAKSASGGFTVLKGAMAGIVANTVTSALSAIGSGITELASTMNANSKAWQTFTGNMKMMGQSTSSINATKKSLQEFAVQTIFSASDMASTYAQLNAVGTKNTLSLVKGFGGLASAAEDPQQAMKTLSQQATQMAAKPTVQWADFKLMLEQTPAGISAIAKTMGMSTSGLVKSVQNGTVKTQDLFDAISKTGTNKAFTKMATQYKTVDQAVDGLTENLANKLQPAFDSMSQVGIQAISAITDGLDKINFTGITNGLGGAFSSIGGVISKVMSSIQGSGAILDLKLAFDALGSGLSLVTSIFQSFGSQAGLAEGVGKALGGIMSTVSGVISQIGVALLQLPVDKISSMFSAVKNTISQLDFSGISNLISAIIPALQSAFTAFLGYVTPALQPLLNAFKNLWNAIQPIITVVASSLMPIFTVLGSFIGGFVSGAMSGITTAFNVLTGVIKFLTPVIQLVGKVIQAVGPILSVVAGFVGKLMGSFTAFNGVMGVVGKVAGSIFKGVAGAGRGLWSSLSGIFKSISGAFRSVGNAFRAVGNSIRSVFSSVGSSAGNAVSRILGAFRGISGRIGGFFSGVYGSISRAIGNVTSIGSNIVRGIANGISGAWGVVSSAIANLTSMIPKKIRQWLGIHSPSRVMRDEVGQYIPQGIAVGMTGQSAYINQKAVVLRDQLTNSLTGFQSPVVGLSSGSLNSSAGLVGSSSNSTSVVINVSGSDPNAVVPLIRRELRRNGIS